VAGDSNDAARLAALAALGLGPDAKARDIISAYRQLARLSHPDMAGQPVSGHDFAAISAAYHFLTRGVAGRPLDVPSTSDFPDDVTSAPQPGAGASVSSPAEAPETPAEPALRASAPAAGDGADDSPLFAAGPVIIRPLPPEPR
jgi:hypothetical protein